MTLSHAQVELRDRLADCTSPASRQLQAPLALAQSANALGGLLYGVTEHGLALLAQSAGEQGSPASHESATRHLHTALHRRAQRAPDPNALPSEPDTSAFGEAEGGPSASGSIATSTGSLSVSVTGVGLRGEDSDGMSPQVLYTARGRALVGVILLRAGAAPLRAPDSELLEVVADVLLAAGDVCPAPEGSRQSAAC